MPSAAVVSFAIGRNAPHVLPPVVSKTAWFGHDLARLFCTAVSHARTVRAHKMLCVYLDQTASDLSDNPLSSPILLLP